MSATQHGAENAAMIRAAAYVSKPFRLDGLIAAVRGLVTETGPEPT